MQVQKFADAVIVKAFPTDGDETQYLNILTDILSQGKEKWGGPFVTLYNLIKQTSTHHAPMFGQGFRHLDVVRWRQIYVQMKDQYSARP